MRGCELTGQCSDIHFINRACRRSLGVSLRLGNDVFFLWQQLLGRLFSFRRRYKLSQLRFEGVWNWLGPLGTQLLAQTQFLRCIQKNRRECCLSSRTYIPSLSYTPKLCVCVWMKPVHVKELPIHTYSVYIYIYTHVHTHTYTYE